MEIIKIRTAEGREVSIEVSFGLEDFMIPGKRPFEEKIEKSLVDVTEWWEGLAEEIAGMYLEYLKVRDSFKDIVISDDILEGYEKFSVEIRKIHEDE